MSSSSSSEVAELFIEVSFLKGQSELGNVSAKGVRHQIGIEELKGNISCLWRCTTCTKTMSVFEEGPIFNLEMNEALLLESDQPLLSEGCVCHTDGAKAYRSLASPLNDGQLLAAGLKLAHTCVKHKHGHPILSLLNVSRWRCG